MMDIRDRIAAEVGKLSPEMQEQVLRFVSSLVSGVPKGENGAILREFSGSLDRKSAHEMIQAIEEACEQVDAAEW
ncbi:MAG: hypothetical protein C5B51_11225 [Terriglobia bacterium]|nr:MAG: hypothetical protein C5B51_11225 [Terriglobia bacterium]